jgi:hypothetical protein
MYRIYRLDIEDEENKGGKNSTSFMASKRRRKAA